MLIIEATWPKIETDTGSKVTAFCTTRVASSTHQPLGASDYRGFNMGLHVGDNPELVMGNREHLMRICQLENSQWLNQIHSTICTQASDASDEVTADACWTDQANLACVVMTADCLPVAFRQNENIAVAHAGWRGLVGGVLENTLQNFDPSHTDIWLGPAIGAERFEVGPEVREQFIAKNALSDSAFAPSANPGKWMADIYALARIRLQTAGVDAERIYGGEYCTFSDEERFYSYRRNSQTGRMATVIYRT